MNLDQLTFLQTQGVHYAFKFGILALLLLFAVFLMIVLKQIKSMNTIVTQPDLFPILQFFNLILIGATLVLFVVGLVIL